MKLHAETTGHGPLLALVHGWGLHSGIWDPVRPALEKQFRLVRLDLPGHGLSPRPHAGFDLARAVEWLSEALPWRCHVLGWSLGATLAMRFALDQPDRVRRLVLVGATPRFLAGPDWNSGMAPDVLEAFAAGLAADYRRTVQDFLTLQMRGDAHGATALKNLRARVFEHGAPSPEALRSGLAVLADTDLRPHLGRLHAPALVLSGDRDRLTPADAGRYLAQALHHARFHAFSRCGHAPFLTHPAEFTDQLQRFLGASEAPSNDP
jgi:pimeloyl-[acyl-carrier protein] methyl ester esterase